MSEVRYDSDISWRFNPCPYCGGTCPSKSDDSPYLCDGYAGDIDGLILLADMKAKEISDEDKNQVFESRRTETPKIYYDLVIVTGLKPNLNERYFKLMYDLSKSGVGVTFTIIKKNANQKDLELAEQISKFYER